MNSCCENCEYWHFPTKSLYQELRVEGICIYYMQHRETSPNDQCDRFRYELKSAYLHNAVAAANELLKKGRFANIMNNDEKIKELKAELAILESGKAMNKELAGSQAAIGTLPLLADLEPVESMPANLIKQIDQITEPTTQAKAGDVLRVAYKAPFKFICGTADMQGNPLEIVCSDPSGKVVVFDVNEVEFRTP